ncbi:MAG: hypothetical protein AAF333_13220 [Planctomycetota bacterium]
MTTLTYHRLQDTHAPSAKLPGAACRDACPLCAGAANRMARSDPRYNAKLQRWTRVCVIFCEHCNAASFATFVCSPDGETAGRARGLGPTAQGLLRSPERFDWFVNKFPELSEVFNG